MQWETDAEVGAATRERVRCRPGGEGGEGGKENQAAGAKATLKEPSLDAFKAYRACRMAGKTRTEVARLLGVKQWKTHRWVKEAAAWIEAGSWLQNP